MYYIFKVLYCYLYVCVCVRARMYMYILFQVTVFLIMTFELNKISKYIHVHAPVLHTFL